MGMPAGLTLVGVSLIFSAEGQPTGKTIRTECLDEKHDLSDIFFKDNIHVYNRHKVSVLFGSGHLF